jgi:hypothetical protein
MSDENIGRLLDAFYNCTSFDRRCACIIEQSNIDRMSRWLASVGVDSAPNPAAARAVFGLMLIDTDAGEMLSKSAIDYVMRDVSAQFSHSLRAAAVDGDVGEFPEVVRRCCGLMMAWRERDAPLTLRFLLDDCVLAKSDGRSPEDVEKLFDRIRTIGGVEAEMQARRRHDRDWTAVQPDDLERRLADAYRLAFWNSLREEAAAGNYERLFAVLQELKDAIKALVAHSERQKALIDERFDVDWLRQQAQHRVLETQLIHSTIRWVADTIISYKASADTPEAIEWGQRILRDTADDSRPFPEVLPVLIGFMQDGFAHVEQIYGRILDMSRGGEEKEGGEEEKKEQG